MDQQVAVLAEPVRLVIWDLDETFWRGTITEGGISEYVQQHHDIVVELAKRGIISSVCSKNDEASTLSILRERGIAEYFVFPSISWEPKGARIAALIEAVQLRPATVMFIDDNPNNRAEAAAFVPDLQIEDETFIARLLEDRRFKGKDDAALSRLAQYRLLEARKRDEVKSGADNSAFLRESDVRVIIEHDVLQHLDRAIELINRTNQLNFTKQRLPERIEHARATLTRQLANFRSQAGLVRVIDRYGDYGFVGFFLIRSNTNPLSAGDVLHYCFSCRTLGLQVERWLYEQLGRPDLKVVGEVQADLFAPGEIDWVRFGGTGDEKADGPKEDMIRINGGCEATVIAHYLRPHAKALDVSSNFASGGWVVALHGASLLLSAADRAGPEFRAECAALRLPYELMVSDFFDAKYQGALFVFNADLDSVRGHRYRHKTQGWEIRLTPDGMPGLNVHRDAEDVLMANIDAAVKQADECRNVKAVSLHLRAHYDPVRPEDGAMRAAYRAILQRLPVGGRIVFVLSSCRQRSHDGTVSVWPSRQRTNEIVREVAAGCPFAAVALFDDAILDEAEIQMGGNHYERMVYARLAVDVMEKARGLVGKGL